MTAATTGDRATASIGTQGIDFTHGESEYGVRNFGLQLEVDGHTEVVEWAVEKGAALQATGQGGERLRCSVSVTELGGTNALVIECRLENTTVCPVHLNRIVAGKVSAAGRVSLGKTVPYDARYCHTDNVRTERYPYCQGEYPYVRTLPVAPVVLGRGQDQPFPGVLLTDCQCRQGLVVAAGSQRHARQSYRLSRAPNAQGGHLDVFEIHYELAQTRGCILEPAETLVLDSIYLQILEDRHPQAAYEDYVAFLQSQYTFRGPTSPMLTQAMYCSWNYGRFSEISEEALLKTARFMKEELPNIPFFLMDAGYARERSERFCDGFYPDPNAMVDVEKFPHGIRHYSDELRRMGLRPGIWWSNSASLDSQLYRDHPDWYLRNRDGGVYCIGPDKGYLDLSLPAVREYLDATLAVVLGEWGMDALKMDFWSQNVEDESAVLANPAMGAVACRTALFEIIRKHLPPDGVFVTCVATGMGNPFIGLHADAYRNTIDISRGGWEQQRHNCLWSLPTLLQPGRQTLLLNQDSLGINPACPQNENRFRLTWCFITMGMLEVGGVLEALSAEGVDDLRKVTGRCDRGYPCRCPDERAFTGEPFPEVLTVDYPQGSPTRQRGVRQALAFFNWTDEPRVISVRRSALGHDGPVAAQDFWSGEDEAFADEFIGKRLDARSALLYDIKE